jgi:hypothetical protein
MYNYNMTKIEMNRTIKMKHCRLFFFYLIKIAGIAAKKMAGQQEKWSGKKKNPPADKKNAPARNKMVMRSKKMAMLEIKWPGSKKNALARENSK